MLNKLQNAKVTTKNSSVYNHDDTSLQGLLNSFYNSINGVIEQSNTVDERQENVEVKVDEFFDWVLTQGLPLEVTNELEKIYVDGRLETIINEKIFEGLNLKVSEVDSKVEEVNSTLSLDISTSKNELKLNIDNLNLEVNKKINDNKTELDTKISDTVTNVESNINDIETLKEKEVELRRKAKNIDLIKSNISDTTPLNSYLFLGDLVKITDGYINRVKRNNNGVVSINMNVSSKTGTNSLTNNVMIGTLFPNFRPTQTIIVPIIVGRDSGTYSGGAMAIIFANGNITVTAFSEQPFKNVYLANINFETAPYENRYTSKKIATFGDSITWYDGGAFFDTHKEYGKLAIGYQSYLVKNTGIEVLNRGVSGDTMITLLQRVKSFTEYANINYVTITSGGNDHRLGTPIGNIAPKYTAFNEATFYGCLQRSIEYILSKNPAIKIFLMTPIKGFYEPSNTTGNPYIGDNGKVLNVKFANAIKEVGKLYNIPVLDWYNDIELTWENKGELLGDKDGYGYWLHPQNNLYGIMGESYSKFIIDNI